MNVDHTISRIVYSQPLITIEVVKQFIITEYNTKLVFVLYVIPENEP